MQTAYEVVQVTGGAENERSTVIARFSNRELADTLSNSGFGYDGKRGRADALGALADGTNVPGVVREIKLYDSLADWARDARGDDKAARIELVTHLSETELRASLASQARAKLSEAEIAALTGDPLPKNALSAVRGASR